MRKPLTHQELNRLLEKHPNAPDAYVKHLTENGYGQLDSGAFTLYGGLVSAVEIFGQPDAAQLQDVLLLGDDMAGRHVGFDTARAWALVEVEHNNPRPRLMGVSFEEFIGERNSV